MISASGRDSTGSPAPERIVVVEDDRELRVFIGEVLEDAGYATTVFGTADRALSALVDDLPADLVITDLVMPGMQGQEFMSRLRKARPELDVIVITAFGSVDLAVELIKAGAHDYLSKPFGPDQLLLRVERALTRNQLQREVARLRGDDAAALAGFVAASTAMRDVFALVRRASGSPHPVLITGESGTGKELVARALHTLSGRRDFVAVNCGALPEGLLESELFGHEKGAFTGATREKEGLFEAADRGTLFLDEVGELPPLLQPKLLRALEDGDVRRVGATRSRKVDARIVAASNRDLEEEIQKGRFRDDLYWRLNVIQIRVPPLRERPTDVLLLVEHFLRGSSGGSETPATGISREALTLMSHYAWPGNVRELRNAVERATVLCAGKEIGVGDLPPRVREAGAMAHQVERAAHDKMTLEELERSYILETLRSVGNNKTRAAELLGIDRKTLYRKLESYGEPD